MLDTSLNRTTICSRRLGMIIHYGGFRGFVPIEADLRQAVLEDLAPIRPRWWAS